ncbi:MAG: bifunctional phosphoglucose/phosphomannose isomerase [Acidobacteriota bacterium]
MLDDLQTVQRRDSQGMLRILGRFDRQLEEALALGEKAKLWSRPPAIKNIVISGMGGSAIGGDFLRVYLGADLNLPLQVSRSYGLPGFASRSTLVFVCSYSGDTEESLSSFERARRNGAQIICLTSNGELGRLADSHGCPCIRLPEGYPPRSAIGYSAIPILMVLGRLGLAPERAEEVRNSLAWVGRRIQIYGPDTPVEENAAKSLATQMHRRVPVIYGSQDRLDVIALRWRSQVAENAKQLAYSGSLPEMNHNEIVGWNHPEPILESLLPIFLRDREDHPRVQIRSEITREMLGDRAGSVLEYWSDGESWLERLWTLVLLGDYASVYLAFLNQENPTPVDEIAVLKDRLKEYP